ncbi:hypothetical protein FHS03_005591 [Massilia violacea]|uniref:Uncharacterized protein n=1 Tax=Pseudoduganella violacea TaxID=1715466 RepID=A0A7W5BHT3_9BURK|nr:hypothetical protein [Pseudoduganella violacea]
MPRCAPRCIWTTCSNPRHAERSLKTVPSPRQSRQPDSWHRSVHEIQADHISQECRDHLYHKANADETKPAPL